MRRRPDEARVVALARGQHGVVTAAQLAAAGFGERTLSRQVAAGWLVRRHVGVYQLGPVAAPFAAEAAALLACGVAAALSHAGGALPVYELRPRPDGMPVDVTVAGSALRRRPGIRPHRVRSLDPRDVTTHHGLRVTTPERTLLDVAARVSERDLARLVEEARLQALATVDELWAVCDRGRGRPGVGKLRAILARDEEPAFTRSEGEQRLREIVRPAGLPMPRTNAFVAGLEVDAVWPAQRLVVEVDGYKFHASRAAFERDRRKDARLTVRGWRVLRVTWRQLEREPETVVAAIAGALAAGTRTAAG